MKFATILACSILAAPGFAAAAEFAFIPPLGTKTTYSEVETTLPAFVPTGRFAHGTIPVVEAPDHIQRTVWVIGDGYSIKDIQEIVLNQLRFAKYEPLMNCVSRDCGGFDFRFGIDVVDEPMMRVDLRDFRFISARQVAVKDPAYVSFLISRSPDSVYIQMIEYTLAEKKIPARTADIASLPDAASFVLEGLVFEDGRAELGDDPNDTLGKLARKLAEDPEVTVLLVGHSDMSGSLEGNVKISTRRAESVRQALIKDHGIAANRLSAHGVGFLAPRADNDTAPGRQKNRRVEAIFSR